MRLRKTVDVRDAGGHLAELLTEASRGTEVILTEGGRESARLVPIPQQPERVPGLHHGTIDTTPDFDAPLPDGFWTGAP
jgi:prevent-host-death family protein